MVVSMNFPIKGSSKWFSLINVVTFLFLSNIGNIIGKENNDFNILDKVLHRSLSKHGFNEEPGRRKLKESLTYDQDRKSAKTGWDEMSTYKTLKKGELSQLELYKKNYKERYNKQKGLKKLDCYWEKKVFDKIEHVNSLAGKTQSRKKRFIKKILNKYTIFFFIFALVPYLGLIIPALFGGLYPSKRYMNVFYGDCDNSHWETGKPNICKHKYTHISEDAGKAMFYINEIFIVISLIAFISMIIYTAVKFIKYEFLKYGLGNVTLKKCFRVCKNAF